MSEMSRIEAAPNAEKSGDARRSVELESNLGEHPDTARHRIQRDFIMAVSSLSRETVDRRYAHLVGLIERAKEELGHARAASNEARMAAMQQNIDELVAYVAGHGISAPLPNRKGDAGAARIAK